MKYKIRPIRFFCPKCGKEMWQGVKFEDIGMHTIKSLLATLICSDCLLKQIKKEEKK
jgi:uncharacterized protein with PIN domain